MEKAQAQWKAFPVPWKERPLISALRQEHQALREQSLACREELGKASSALQALRASLEEVRGLDRELSQLEGNYARAARLSKLLSGANPLKMPILQYVLSVMLEDVYKRQDQPDKPPAVLQRGQGFHGGVQGFPVQAAKALVDEQGIQPHRAGMVLHHV